MSRRRTQSSRAPGRVVQHVKVRSPRLLWLRLQKCAISGGKWLLILGLIGAGLYGSREAITRTIEANNDFHLTHLEIETNGHFTQERLLEVCEIEMGQSYFSFDLDAMDALVTALPEVAEANFYRRWPDTLKVEIREREPIAWVACEDLGVMARDANRGMLLDADGYIFQCDADAYPGLRDLAVIHVVDATREMIGPGIALNLKAAKRAVALLEMHEEISRRRPGYPMLESVEVHTQRAYLTGRFSIGTEVIFGLYDHERQLTDLVALWRHSKAKQSFLARANLLGKRNIPVEMLPINPARAVIVEP